MGRVGGAIFVKAALRLRGLDVGDTRLPLPPPTEQQVRDIAADLRAAGVPLGPTPPGGRTARTRTGGAEVAYR